MKNRYFFCSAGIYITVKLSEIVRSQKLNKFFYTCTDTNSALDIFNELYSLTFTEFNNYWRT